MVENPRADHQIELAVLFQTQIAYIILAKSKAVEPQIFLYIAALSQIRLA